MDGDLKKLFFLIYCRNDSSSSPEEKENCPGSRGKTFQGITGITETRQTLCSCFHLCLSCFNVPFMRLRSFFRTQATNYVLEHQEADSQGELETKLIKVSSAKENTISPHVVKLTYVAYS